MLSLSKVQANSHPIIYSFFRLVYYIQHQVEGSQTMKQNVLGLLIVFAFCAQGTLFAQRAKTGSTLLAGENEKKNEARCETNFTKTATEKAELQSAPPVKVQSSASVAVGELAPDFELPRLDLVLKGGTQSNDVVMVKLSSFRGKKPVALLFSSFT